MYFPKIKIKFNYALPLHYQSEVITHIIRLALAFKAKNI